MKPALRMLAATALASALAAPGAALAQAAARDFSIPAKPLAAALVDFAVQADISIGADAARRCRPLGNPVSGRYTVRQGLARLLAGTGCTYRMVDARTIRIVRAPLAIPHRAPAPAASAPPPPVETMTTVGPLVVTSAKRSVGLDRAPFAVSAVPGQDLAQTGASGIADLASRISGLTVTNLGPGRNKLFVRGLSDGALTGRTQATVGLYVDDTRITYNAPDPDLRLVDIERVELLRGPQGSLYGAGSIGGVLQVITRRPDLEERSGWISTTGEATGDGAPSGVVEGGFNLPLVRDVLGLRAVVYREVAGGFIDDVGLGLEDVDDTRRQGARLSLRWDISPNWTAGAGLVTQTLHTDDTHYAQAGLGGLARSLFLPEPHRNDFDELHIRLRGDLGWGVINATSAYQTHEIESRYDATLALPAFSAAAPGAAPFDEEGHTEAVVSELTLASPTGGRLEWLGGLFSSEFRQTTTSDLSAPMSLYREVRDDDIDEYAAYGEATWRITPSISVTAGGRHFQLSVETASTVTQPGEPPAAFARKRTDHSFAPKLVLRYEPSDRMLFYLQGAEGYRAGGFNTAGRVGQAFPELGAGPQPHRLFTGDELTNLEAGARLAFFGGRLRLRTAVFQAHWENIQTEQLLPEGLPFTANIGDGHNRGFEVEAVYQAGGLRLDGNLLVGDPELDRASPDFAHLAGQGLPGVPRLLAGAGGRYEWGEAELRRFVSAEVSYVGSSTLTFDAVTARRMGDYWTTRLAAGLQAERWGLTAYVENLFNQAGDTFAYGNPFSLRLTDQQTPQRPLTGGVVLTRDF